VTSAVYGLMVNRTFQAKHELDVTVTIGRQSILVSKFVSTASS
jgi:hypothetical protein